MGWFGLGDRQSEKIHRQKVPPMVKLMLPKVVPQQAGSPRQRLFLFQPEAVSRRLPVSARSGDGRPVGVVGKSPGIFLFRGLPQIPTSNQQEAPL
jgi:hypothetical protein